MHGIQSSTPKSYAKTPRSLSPVAVPGGPLLHTKTPLVNGLITVTADTYPRQAPPRGRGSHVRGALRRFGRFGRAVREERVRSVVLKSAPGTLGLRSFGGRRRSEEHTSELQSRQ